MRVCVAEGDAVAVGGRVTVAVAVGEAVGAMRVCVAVGDAVRVGQGVSVGVCVAVAGGMRVCVTVGVGVMVLVGGRVTVAVGVAVGVWVLVGGRVTVAVAVGEAVGGIRVCVDVGVDVRVDTRVTVGVADGVGVGSRPNSGMASTSSPRKSAFGSKQAIRSLLVYTTPLPKRSTSPSVKLGSPLYRISVEKWIHSRLPARSVTTASRPKSTPRSGIPAGTDGGRSW